jgi:hypothetical protein
MTVTMTSDELRRHVERLQAVGDQMEAAGDPRWFSIASAAAVLEGLRLGITLIVDSDASKQMAFSGFDPAKPGKDRSVFWVGDRA